MVIEANRELAEESLRNSRTPAIQGFAALSDFAKTLSRRLAAPQ
jgi:hypothetical protein